MMNLEKKVVVITGASSGIGRGCAVAFAKEGAFLALSGRSLDGLKETKDECIKAGVPEDKVLLVQADLIVDAECKKLVDEVVKYFKKIDILINNAGVLVSGGLEDLSLEDYDRQMNINTRSPLLLTKLALPYLKTSKGNIVNVSSVAGTNAFPGLIAYTMSKAAMDQFTRCLALELADVGVRVNSVNPGVIVTEVHRRAGMGDEDYKEFLKRCKTTHALGRVGEVREVADAVVFLASDKASFTTGHLLAVDGGRGIMCPR